MPLWLPGQISERGVATWLAGLQCHCGLAPQPLHHNGCWAKFQWMALRAGAPGHNSTWFGCPLKWRTGGKFPFSPPHLWTALSMPMVCTACNMHVAGGTTETVCSGMKQHRLCLVFVGARESKKTPGSCLYPQVSINNLLYIHYNWIFFLSQMEHYWEQFMDSQGKLIQFCVVIWSFLWSD